MFASISFLLALTVDKNRKITIFFFGLEIIVDFSRSGRSGKKCQTLTDLTVPIRIGTVSL